MADIRSIDDIALSLSQVPDKASPQHGYAADVYDRYFGPLREKPISLLEIGVQEGPSMMLWSQVFPEGKILGIDVDLSKCKFHPSNVWLEECDVNNSERLHDVASRHGPFDVVIDDGSHFAHEQMAAFRTLWAFVKPGGYFVIEDLQVNYWYGAEGSAMVDFLGGELQRALHARGTILWARPSPEEQATLSPLEQEIEFIHLYRYIAVLRKRNERGRVRPERSESEARVSTNGPDEP